MIERVKWPAGFKGGIVWCPHCANELMRIPEGEERTTAEQQAAKAAHDLVCTGIRLVEP